MPAHVQILPAERIQGRILVLRGQRVLLDSDLAAIYEVPTKRLNEAVKRNIEKFPADFMFQLTREEAAALHVARGPSADTQQLAGNRSQIATGVSQHRARQQRPFAFTISALPRFVAAIVEAIRQLVEPVVPANPCKIGFHPGNR